MRFWKMLALAALAMALMVGFTVGSAAAAPSANAAAKQKCVKKVKKGKKKTKVTKKCVKPVKGDPGSPGAPGQNGQDGADGADGSDGDDGSDGSDGQDATVHDSNWNPITRNNIGSPHLSLMAGPRGSFGVTGPLATPPHGNGSLYIGVNAVPGHVEKASFGNEVDFFGDDPTTYDELGFHVFQTGENVTAGGTRNLPNLTFELDPNVGGASAAVNYTSLVYLPDAVSPVNQWSGYIDATASGDDWYFTNGTLATQTGCNQTTYCDWSQIVTALSDGDNPAPAAVYTAAVGKGRDFAWFGAVDGWVIDDTVYNAEQNGVHETPLP